MAGCFVGLSQTRMSQALQKVFARKLEVNIKAAVESGRPDLAAEHAMPYQKECDAAAGGNFHALKTLHETGFALQEACSQLGRWQQPHRLL